MRPHQVELLPGFVIVHPLPKWIRFIGNTYEKDQFGAFIASPPGASFIDLHLFPPLLSLNTARLVSGSQEA